MTAPAPPTDVAAADAAREARAKGDRRGRLTRLAVRSVLVLLLVGTAALGGLAVGLRTDAGRALVVRALDGLSLGPAGRLRLAGLKGDVLGRFSLAVVEIDDGHGSWLAARDVSVRWRPAALLARSVHVLAVSAAEVTVRRQPRLGPHPPAPPGRPPLSLQIDRAAFRLTTSPAFSVAEGSWSVDGGARLRRSGALRIALQARSLKRAGDGAVLELRFGDHDAFRLRAELVEAEGGAAAGALGLPADQPLRLTAGGAGAGSAGAASGSLVSGGRTLATAQAAWGKQGASGEARLVLGASRWTRYLAARLGDAADLELRTRPGPGRLISARATLTSVGGRLLFDGPVDGQGQARSASLKVEVADLSRWIPAPKVGPGVVEGLVSGSFQDFSVKGRLLAHGVEAGGYRMAAVEGPLSLGLHGGEWRFTGDLRGLGGQGDALSASVLGPAPKVFLDVSALRDGRMLVRSLKIDGAALHVAASGGESLLGGLGFSGTADLTDLSRVRQGMGGALTAAFDATEAKGADRWSFTLKGSAKGLSTGLAEADHFFGGAPRISASGAFAVAKGLDLAAVEIVGASASVAGKGGLDPAGLLSGAFQWRASGPFAAGPLEIAGAASGEGALSGALKAPRLDLKAELAAIDFGPLKASPAKLTMTVIGADQGIAGALSVAGTEGPYGALLAKTSFQVSKNEASLSDLVVEAGGLKGSGSLTLKQGRIVRGDASFVLGPGAFISEGRAEGRVQLEEGAAGAFKGRIVGGDLSFREAQIRLASLRVDAEGPLRALPIRFQAEGQAGDPFSFAGKGVVRAQGQELAADLEGAGRINKAAFSLVGPAALRLGPAQSSLSLSAAAAGGTVRADLRRSGEEVTGEIRAQTIDVAELAGDFVGKVSGELDLSGRGPHLSGRLASRIAGLRSRDEPESEGLSGTVTAALENGRLRLKADAVNVAGLKSHGEADLPAEASAVPFRIAVDRTKPLTGGFSVEGEVRPLWDVLAGGERSLAGRINASGVVAGSMNRLLLTGTASLSQGRFQDIASGLQLQGLGVEAVFGQDALVVNRFSAADGRGGSISGDGRVSFEEGGASTFRLTLKKFQLLDNDTGRATASGSVLVAHPAKGEGKISGELIVDRADIVAAAPTPTGVVPMDVVEIHQKQQHGPEPAAAARAGPPIGLDVAVRAARGVYLKGRGLNLELSLESRVTGSVDHPAFEGVARVVAGNYDFAGKRFDVESSGTIHLGATAAQIRLDLSATWSDPTITAVVKVQGTAAKPEITLTSSPVLPQDEILARVLFGVSASQLAPAQGAEMASALASLAGGGGFDVIGNLRQFAGLDRLALGATQTAQTTISGGKYISKDVYLELTGGARNGTGASVEWRIQKNLSLISRYGAALDPRYPNDSDASLSIRFRRDF